MNGPLWCPHLDLDLFFERLRVRQFNLKLGPPEAIQTHVSAHSTNRDSGLPIADSLEGGRHSFVSIFEVHTVDFVSYVPSPLPPQSQSPLSLLPPRMQQQCVQCRSQEAKAAATNGRSFLLRIRTLTLASAVRFSTPLFFSSLHLFVFPLFPNDGMHHCTRLMPSLFGLETPGSDLGFVCACSLG